MGRSRPWIGLYYANKRIERRKTHREGEVDGDSYTKRGIALLKLGFISYTNYLNSDLWSGIRSRAYQIHGRNCKICKNPATALHHLDYSLDTLKGFRMNSLIPICDECHKKVEFDGEIKRPVHEVRQITLSLISKKKVRKSNTSGGWHDCPGCGCKLGIKKPMCAACKRKTPE